MGHDYQTIKGQKLFQNANVPRINLDGLKESPMIIDHSQISPEGNQYEYEYHSADKGNVAAIETSMQSYSRHIARHLGSGAKKTNKGQSGQQVHNQSDESSEHDKDEIQTKEYAGTNRHQDANFEHID